MAAVLDGYASEYQNTNRMRPSGPAWLAQTRNEALARFLSLGFPTTRDEEWRFTSVAPIASQAFVLSDEPVAHVHAIEIQPYRLPGVAGAELVFVNGRYAPALSTFAPLPGRVRVESLASALADRPEELKPYVTRLAPFEEQAFSALNTAFLADGACIQIPARTIVAEPIHVLFVSTEAADGRSTMSHPRVLLVMGNESQASVVESYAGPGGGSYFTNALVEIALGENAVLEHYKLQRESVRSFHVGAMHVRAERNANFVSHAISLGGALARNDVTAVLDGEGVECTLNGLYLADEARHVDTHTTIDHAKPHCDSRELYKGILADRARGVFNGKIIVRPDAQKTDAKQTNRALLLSEDAQINTKPQLEIFANDVKCTHGAAVGQLDDEAVFYLRSRGLGASEARHLLIRAFASDVLNRMPREAIRASVEEVLLRQLSRALQAA